ncbi:MAG: ABC transporter permease [Endomicrobium sp.]|nr:ABC transporter permease [Endomicrobium sp.]
MKVIELKNLKKTYHLEKLDVPVLHGINLEIMQGEFVAIMGHSGSGKSTLLNILGLLDKPSEGSYKLAGIEVSKYSDDELASLRNHFLGFVFQQFNLLPKLTILENVALPVIYANSKDENLYEDPEKLLNMVGLSTRIKHHPNEISGGQQQRVAIARALTNKPLIIFADEPTGNLDTKSSNEIIKILKDLNDAGITIVMVTHEVELTAHAKRIIKIQDGLILSDEKTVEEINTNTNKNVKTSGHKNFSLLRIKDYFVEAFRSLIGNKMRSILSILGVMIGVASLIAMLAIGTGAKKYIEKQFSDIGVNLLIVYPEASHKGTSSDKSMHMKLRIEDIDDIKENISGLQAVSGDVTGSVQVVANGHNCGTTMEGSSASYAEIRNSYPSSGRFFTEDENKKREKVVLLGKTVVKEIFGNEDFNPIGEYIKINRIDFQVIGVLPSKNKEEDNKVIIPLNTAMYRMIGTKSIHWMYVQVKDGINMKDVSDAITKRLLFTHRMPASEKDVVGITNMAEIQEKYVASTRIFSLLLGSIAFISLLVGGIGIMNIMFVSVSERTKEIGLRKAIGANNKDILFQFIIESIVICCTGGIIGILFGTGAAILVSKVSSMLNTYISIFSIVLAFCFSCLIGLFFGILPARKASLLNPIDALRRD